MTKRNVQTPGDETPNPADSDTKITDTSELKGAPAGPIENRTEAQIAEGTSTKADPVNVNASNEELAQKVQELSVLVNFLTEERNRANKADSVGVKAELPEIDSKEVKASQVPVLTKQGWFVPQHWAVTKAG